MTGSTGFARHCAGTVSALPQAGKLAVLANGGLSRKGEQQQMSDTVWVAMVAAVPGVVASVLGYLNQREIRHATAIAEKNAALGEKNEKHLLETKTAMVTLEQNTNSIKDELVRTTALASRAVGNLEGRAEQKAEHVKESEEHSG
jgi:hypothetical protein